MRPLRMSLRVHGGLRRDVGVQARFAAGLGQRTLATSARLRPATAERPHRRAHARRRSRPSSLRQALSRAVACAAGRGAVDRLGERVDAVVDPARLVEVRRCDRAVERDDELGHHAARLTRLPSLPIACRSAGVRRRKPSPRPAARSASRAGGWLRRPRALPASLLDADDVRQLHQPAETSGRCTPSRAC